MGLPSPKFHKKVSPLFDKLVKFTVSGEQPLVLGPATIVAVTGPMLKAIFKAASLQFSLESTILQTPAVVGNGSGHDPGTDGTPPQLAHIAW